MIKIGFVSTVDSDDLVFEEVYKEVKKYGIKFKILDYNCSEMEFNEFLEFIKDANIVFTKLMGGKSAFKYFDELKAFTLKNDIPFLPLPTLNEIHPDLDEATTVSSDVKLKVIKYLGYEGVENYKNLLLYLANTFGNLNSNIKYEEPKLMPWQGIYYKNKYFETLDDYINYLIKNGKEIQINNNYKHNYKPVIGILFYRNWFIANNVDYVDDLINIIEDKGALPIAVFTSHLENELGAIGTLKTFEKFFYKNNKPIIHSLINTTLFTLSMGVKPDLLKDEPEFLKKLNVPILQAIVSTGYIEDWKKSIAGINPIDLVIGMAMPEFDGTIIHFPIGGKEKIKDGEVGAPIIKYKSIKDRVEKIVDLSLKYANLKLKENKDKRIAIIFHNYPPRNDKIASAFGLDSPESVLNILKELKNRGFDVNPDLYKNGTDLIKHMLNYATNDKRFLTEELIKKAVGNVKKEDYEKWFNNLSEKVKYELIKDWGEIPGDVMNFDGKLIIPGIINGNIFISVQAPRGFGENPSAIYHSPDLSPPHYYIAFYKWIKNVFKADAVMHIGKHGNLEWLPGKCVGLSRDCYPDVNMELPNIYPYIVNNPGEGTQAKRRSYATIISHLIPPMTISDLYAELSELEKDIDEYYEVEGVEKKDFLKKNILNKIKELKLDEDLMDGNTINKKMDNTNFENLLNKIHDYLEELKNRQINEGLHIMGVPLCDDKLINMIFMIIRYQFNYLEIISNILGYDWDKLNENMGQNHKIIDKINEIAINLLNEYKKYDFNENEIKNLKTIKINSNLKEILKTVSIIYKSLMRVDDEIKHAVDALEGKYVPPRIAGAPTKDINCLPTGRNFYSCNPQEIPTKTAYEMGKRLADDLVNKYLDEEGKYPEYLGVIVWGSPTMRTKGDDIGEILYLLGVKPIWNKMGRVIGTEVIPLSELRRPRIDLTLRVSGLFRDTFPQVIDLIDDAVRKVANLNEPDEMNYIKKHYKQDVEEKLKNGIDEKIARETSLYRIFSDKPGTYGAGVANLIDEKNWESIEDLAKVFVEWGGYAYGKNIYGIDAKKEFVNRLSKIELTVKNEDSQEWDIFEGDDFNSYHGGLIAAVTHYSKKQPKSYIGDTSNPNKIKTKHLKEEGKQIFRTKILNPKWIEGLKKHGYKGAGDFSKYIDHMFAWDCTSNIIDDWMYEKIAEKYVFDKEMEEFFKENNPYALMNITERLLEAIEREKWNVNNEMKEKLRKKYLDIEGMIEEKL
ncbi:cobaltochelatase subunit CobN [Methanothermococcus okinawensis]|uniref:Cobaltochelatase., Magnesium chelatase n=1 Tax=Methanothermococcus okinawensis (strain DSM 14208 / JCM 11175 / IH1) TaxID=647113 RepID=F8AM91_METOI|nr:cobaltochelatase subunit CobN [Methanothermococcus okinawensis]AEH06780.1 Cobaltochelatase., Magnesium chelatase [Methanothermococcus okinawensis IH1]